MGRALLPRRALGLVSPQRDREFNKRARYVTQHQFSQEILLVQWLDLAQVLIVREPVLVLRGCHSGADNEKYFLFFSWGVTVMV